MLTFKAGSAQPGFLLGPLHDLSLHLIKVRRDRLEENCALLRRRVAVGIKSGLPRPGGLVDLIDADEVDSRR